MLIDLVHNPDFQALSELANKRLDSQLAILRNSRNFDEVRHAQGYVAGIEYVLGLPKRKRIVEDEE